MIKLYSRNSHLGGEVFRTDTKAGILWISFNISSTTGQDRRENIYVRKFLILRIYGECWGIGGRKSVERAKSFELIKNLRKINASSTADRKNI